MKLKHNTSPISLFPSLLLIFLFFNVVVCQTPSSEIEGLEEIFNKMGGANDWINKTNWMIGDPCDPDLPWFGISCKGNPQNSQTTIQSINLANNNLQNSIPEIFSLLPNLEFLYMNNNNINGSLPLSLFNSSLPLQILILGMNDLIGSIPADIGNLAESLTYLDLQHNSLFGPLPPSLFSLSLLSGLQLNNNLNYESEGLSGTIDDSIGNLTKLTNLHLEQNSFSGTLPPSLFSLSSLSELFLGNNPFIGTIPSSIGNLTNLVNLQISNTKINGSIPESLFNLRSLNYLNLGLNQLSGTISNSIGNLNKLTQLNLQSVDSVFNTNRFYGDIPPSLWNITSLQYLYLSFNTLTGTIPESINQIKQLITFDIGQNLISGTIPRTLFELKSLGTLYLHDNQLVGTLIGDLFYDLPNLQNLLLYSNQLSGVVPSTFFSNYSLSGSTVLADNPFLCPIPSFAVGPPLSASCRYWSVEGASPGYGGVEGGDVITITGNSFSQLTSNLFCSFSNSTTEISANFTSPAVYINSTTLSCISPPHPPSSDIPNFGITIWFFDTSSNMFFITSNDILLAVSFIFERTPSLLSLSPSSSPQLGGALLSVEGRDFAATDKYGVLVCRFGGVMTSPATFVNSSFIYCPSANLNSTGEFDFAVSNDNSSFSNSSLTIVYYRWCEEENGMTCNGEGECNNATSPAQCECNEQHSGKTCADCAGGFYGSTCLLCPNCHHGDCSDGIYGDGFCICDWDYLGPYCDIPWFLLAVLICCVLIGCLVFLLIVSLVTHRLRVANDLKRRSLLHSHLNGEKYSNNNDEFVNYEEDNSPDYDEITPIKNSKNQRGSSNRYS